MTTTTAIPAAPTAPTRKRGKTLATNVISWAFVIGSLLGVGFVALNHAPGERAAILIDGHLSAIGLTYTGTTGLAMAWAQVVVIGAAAAASLARISFVRRLGLALLVGWATLWTGNAVWLAFAGSAPALWAAAAGVFAVFTAACALRARRNW